MTKQDQCYKAPKQKKNRMSKEEFKKYSIWVFSEYPICQICFKQESVDLHHILYGAYKDDTTVYPVCRACHIWCHSNKKESQSKYLEKAKKIYNDYCNRTR